MDIEAIIAAEYDAQDYGQGDELDQYAEELADI